MWQDLDASRLIRKCSGFYIIKPKNTPDPTPLFCDVCKRPNLTPDDTLLHRRYGCCAQCTLRWVDVYKEKWLAGWRPSSLDIENELKRRYARPMILPF